MVSRLGTLGRITWRDLARKQGGDLPEPVAAPCGNGSVQVEWSIGRRRLEVVVPNAGLVATFATLLLMFVLQRAQNKDFRAVHIKLDELVAAIEGARPHFIHAEDRTEAELERLRKMVEPAVDPEASSSTSSGSLDRAR